MTSGAHRVDTEWLGERVGGTFSRADATTVKAATGQVIGGIAPLGHPAPLRTFVDVSLADYPEIWAAAGHAHTVFPLSYEQLVVVTGGTVTAVVA
jgi:prolyl-tRNA editing enzyme YbaK/EbsC (Cys-tRNA(Pro) deacylase)